MAFDPLSAAFELGKTAIEKIWPDPAKQQAELRKLEELRQKGELDQLNAEVQLLLGQIEINKLDAKSGNFFQSGWRPFIGWAGGFSLAYAGFLYPLLTWVWGFLQASGVVPQELSPPPFVESGTLGAIVTGMLGIGSMRSYDKIKSTDTK